MSRAVRHDRNPTRKHPAAGERSSSWALLSIDGYRLANQSTPGVCTSDHLLSIRCREPLVFFCAHREH
ncbi:hypothetical protein I552_5874 [Mycobacterium xenopi 3993]|nr:hypothetical protein I552_5874 [Mycobacterium xenopi 3993]